MDDWLFDPIWLPEPISAARRRGSVLVATLMGLGVAVAGAAVTVAVAVWNDEGTWAVTLVVAYCTGWVVRTFERGVALGWRRMHAAVLMVVAIVVADYAYLTVFDGEEFAPVRVPLADFVDWELELLSSPPVLGALLWSLPVGLAVLGVLGVDEGEGNAAPAQASAGIPLPAAQVVSVDDRGGDLGKCAVHVVFEQAPHRFVHRMVICRSSDVTTLTPFLLHPSTPAVKDASGRRLKVRDRRTKTAAEAFDEAYHARPPARTRQWLSRGDIPDLASSLAVRSPRPAGRHRAHDKEGGQQARHAGPA